MGVFGFEKSVRKHVDGTRVEFDMVAIFRANLRQVSDELEESRSELRVRIRVCDTGYTQHFSNRKRGLGHPFPLLLGAVDSTFDDLGVLRQLRGTHNLRWVRNLRPPFQGGDEGGPLCDETFSTVGVMRVLAHNRPRI